MNSLSIKIKEKLAEQNLSVHVLEKSAGLKPSAVQNIIYGRSKNPSITLISAIARVLNCTIEDLVDSSHQHTAVDSSNFETRQKQRQVYQQSPKNWNQELYLKCFDIVHSILNQKNITVDKIKILDFVEEIYNYSLGNGFEAPDKYFAKWLVEKSKNKS